MLNLRAPRNMHASLRSFYDQLESSIRSLESLRETHEKYGSFLVPTVLSKLPSEIRKHLTRENGSDKWILADLRRALHKKLIILEAGQRHTYQMYSRQRCHSVESNERKLHSQGRITQRKAPERHVFSAVIITCQPAVTRWLRALNGLRLSKERNCVLIALDNIWFLPVVSTTEVVMHHSFETRDRG